MHRDVVWISWNRRGGRERGSEGGKIQMNGIRVTTERWLPDSNEIEKICCRWESRIRLRIRWIILVLKETRQLAEPVGVFWRPVSCLLVQIIPKIISPVNIAVARTVQSSLPSCCASVNMLYLADLGPVNSFLHRTAGNYYTVGYILEVAQQPAQAVLQKYFFWPWDSFLLLARCQTQVAVSFKWGSTKQVVGILMENECWESHWEYSRFLSTMPVSRAKTLCWQVHPFQMLSAHYMAIICVF